MFSSEVKVEQFSPQSAHYLDPNSHPGFYPTPETPPRKQFGSSAAPASNPVPGAAPTAAPYFNPSTPAPNFIAFTTTEYAQPSNQRNATNNSFNDLFPGYKPSISTEEQHGRFRAPARFNVPATPAPGCQFQNSENSYNRSYSEDVKPVYIQQTTQQQPQQPGQFLQTISSPPPTNGLRGVPNRQPGNVLLTTVPSAAPPNQIITTPSTFQHPATSPNVMVTASQTPNVMVTTPANVIVMGQPGYVSNYVGPTVGIPARHQVPNVTLRTVPLHTEEPVVGMPVSTGYSEPQQMSTSSTPVSATYSQQQTPSLHLNNNTNIGSSSFTFRIVRILDLFRYFDDES